MWSIPPTGYHTRRAGFLRKDHTSIFKEELDHYDGEIKVGLVSRIFNADLDSEVTGDFEIA